MKQMPGRQGRRERQIREAVELFYSYRINLQQTSAVSTFCIFWYWIISRLSHQSPADQRRLDGRIVHFINVPNDRIASISSRPAPSRQHFYYFISTTNG